MPIRIVRLGGDRIRDDGVRIGTVRHPPRSVPKNQHASGNWYDNRTFPSDVTAPMSLAVTDRSYVRC